MIEAGSEADLAQEAFGAEGGGHILAQDLDGDPAIVAQVLGKVDRGHAPLADLAVDPVAVGKGGSKAFAGRSHRATRCAAPGRRASASAGPSDGAWPGCCEAAISRLWFRSG